MGEENRRGVVKIEEIASKLQRKEGGETGDNVFGDFQLYVELNI